MRVLLIDDDPKIAELIGRIMKRNEIEFTSSSSGQAGLAVAVDGGFDAILLDLMMPGWDGFDTLRRIRSEGIRTPVLFLTGSDRSDNVVRALESGGDDFIEKPFDPRELVARIRAVARRASGESDGGPDRRVAFDRLEIDTLLHRAWWDSGRVPLTRTELRILQALVLASGGIVAREDLMRVGWGDDPEVGPDSLGVHVSNLRKRLAEAGADGLVETVRGQGYRLRAAG